jgi:hypothetical protein
VVRQQDFSTRIMGHNSTHHLPGDHRLLLSAQSLVLAANMSTVQVYAPPLPPPSHRDADFPIDILALDRAALTPRFGLQDRIGVLLL